MKRKFSRSWVSSTQLRKQRKFRLNAPLHVRQKLMGCRLEKKLAESLKSRSLPVRKGDRVMIMRGSFKKLPGEVTEVNLKKLAVYVDCAKRKKSSGQEISVPIDPSNLMIIEIRKDDKKRQKAIERKSKK
jgi:large subunit ribosomal protein L24